VLKNLYLVLVDSLIWIIWSIIVGYLVNKISDTKLEELKLLPLSKYTASRIQTLTRIKFWKDALPEAGAMFKEGTSKRNLSSTSTEALNDLRLETLRAEFAHYLFPLILPIFFVFNPWYLSLAMVFYAFFANIPFILIQRYNRSRLESALLRRNNK